MVLISVIIPALNEEDSIGYCLQSLLNQSIERDSYEIIVVDGGSDDRTATVSGKFADLVVSQERSGIGGARGDGVRASHGEILVFTDADTLHKENWLEMIRDNLRHHGYDVSSGPVLFYDRTFRSELLQLWRKQYNFLHLFEFYWLIGSNMAMSRKVYEQIGGHRDISVLEDYDLSVRMYREGDIRCCYDPRQVVYTSARRLSNLLSYLLLYLYGHYHYHVTKDYRRLLKYPRFDEMDLRLMSDIIGLNKLNEKISTAYATFISNVEKERRL